MEEKVRRKTIYASLYLYILVILPQSALMTLMTRTGSGPILFSIDNMETGSTTYTSVLEFIAEEGRIYLPEWVHRHWIFIESLLILFLDR